MKYLKYILFSVLLMLAGCKKEESGNPASRDLQNHEFLVQAAPGSMIDPDLIIDSLYNGRIAELSQSSSSGVLRFVTPLLVSQLNGTNAENLDKMDGLFEEEAGRDGKGQRRWQVESYKFTYRSKSARGEDVVLSGRVSFPNNTVPGVPHRVQTLTLNMHHALPYLDYMPSGTFDMWNLRVLHNSAVIQPDGQGLGANLDKDFYCAFSSSVLARQLADCTMAALELMKERGVTLAEDGHSICTSCSLGAAVPVAFARYYETEAPAAQREAIRLAATYTGCGPVDPVATMRYYSEHPDFNAMLSKSFICSLQAYSPVQLKGYEPSDFVSDIFLSTMTEYEGRQMSYFEAEGRYLVNVLGTNETLPNPTGLSEILSPDMLTADGRIDESAPKTKVLFGLMADENNIDNWRPRLPIYLVHCRQDDGIPFEQAWECYERLSGFGTNRNVHFSEGNLPRAFSAILGLVDMGVIHALSTALFFLPAYLAEDPAVELTEVH